MEKICCIFGAGEYGTEKTVLPDGDVFVIAADAGYAYTKKCGIKPDLAVGDFDSLGYTPDDCCIERHPAIKDDTDMLLAVKEGLKRGFTSFYIYGGLGGRADHAYANYQLLSYIAERCGTGFLLGEKCFVTAIKNGKLIFSGRETGTVSVFCAGEFARGVYLRNLKYPLTDATVSFEFPIGVSNEFIGKPAEIEVNDGVLTVFAETAEEFVLPRFEVK